MNVAELLKDRLQVNSLLIVLCFVSVFTLSSQSAASYPSYFLAFSMLLNFKQWNDVFSVRLAWLVLAFVTYLCASSFWSESFSWREVASVFGRGLLVFSFVVAMAECQQRGQVQRWLGRILGLVGGIIATFVILIFLVEAPPDGRLQGFGQLTNSVVVGLILAVVLILLLDLIAAERKMWRLVLAVVCSVFVVVAIYLTGSRNAWVSALIGVGVFVGAHRIRDPQEFVAALLTLLVIVAVALSALFLNENTRDWVLPRGDSYRLDIWRLVLSEVSNHNLWLGKGVLTPDTVSVEGKVFSHPHSMYISVFYQGGLVALSIWGLVLAGVFRTLFGNFQQPEAKLALSLLMLALSSYMLDGHELLDKVGETWFLFWLPVALSLGLSWSRSLRER